MASANLPLPPSGALDRPPPSPLNPPPQGGFAGTGIPPQAPGGPAPGDGAKQVVQMGTTIDQALLAFADMAPGGKAAELIGQARKLLQAATAEIIQSQGAEPSAAGSTGSQFPAGGMTSGRPF